MGDLRITAKRFSMPDQASQSIWRPVGKQPSDLWIGEMNEFNDLFLDLFRYFGDHESYSVEYLQDWKQNDALVSRYGSMKITRMARWFAYFGLVSYEKSHVQKKGEEKQKLLHTFKPTREGFAVFESGRVLEFRWAHLTKASKIGVGKGYPVFKSATEWLDSKYAMYKVAQWRQQKWHSEFVRLFNDNLGKADDGMDEALKKWMLEKIATLPRRKLKATTMACEATLCKGLGEWIK